MVFPKAYKRFTKGLLSLFLNYGKASQANSPVLLTWCTENFSRRQKQYFYRDYLGWGYEKQNIIFIREKTTFFIGPALTFKPSHRQMPFPSFSSSPLTSAISNIYRS